jgi:hypothetical protein
MANPTIGYITCPITGEKDCDVRRYSTGKKSLYYVSSAGKITPNLPAGQAFMKSKTAFIGENGEPLKPVNEKKTVNEKKGLLNFLIGDDE